MPTRSSFAFFSSKLLIGSLLLFLGLLISVEHSKLTNNAFYITLMLPGLLLLFKRPPSISPAGITLVSFLLYMALSTFWGADDLGDGFKQLKYVIYIIAFLVITHQAASSNRHISLIASAGFLLTLSLEAHSLYMQIANIGLEKWLAHFPRLLQTTGPLNAVYMSLTIGLFGFILIASRVRNPWMATALVCALILVTLPLQSRTLILSLVVAHSYLLFRQKAFHALIFWIIFCLAAGGALLLSIDRFTGAVHRDGIWLYAINAWIDDCSMIFGCGNRHNFNINIEGTYFYNPHSILLSQMLYGGLTGLLLLGAVAWTMRQEFHRIAPYWPPVFLYSLTACLTIGHSLLTHPDFIWLLTWLPLALSGILFNPAERIKQAKQHHEADANPAVPV